MQPTIVHSLLPRNGSEIYTRAFGHFRKPKTNNVRCSPYVSPGLARVVQYAGGLAPPRHVRVDGVPLKLHHASLRQSMCKHITHHCRRDGWFRLGEAPCIWAWRGWATPLAYLTTRASQYTAVPEELRKGKGWRWREKKGGGGPLTNLRTPTERIRHMIIPSSRAVSTILYVEYSRCCGGGDGQRSMCLTAKRSTGRESYRGTCASTYGGYHGLLFFYAHLPQTTGIAIEALEVYV